MMIQSTKLTRAGRRVLARAAEDFFLLQNRGYPRSAALQWVGDRYALAEAVRQLLHRGVLGQREALSRRAKRCMGADWRREELFVDGHNVQITVESAVVGRTLLLGNDKALRDVAGQSARFRISETSEAAMAVIFRFLGELRPPRMVFLFDAPMSHSGTMAAMYRERMRSLGLAGEAKTVPVPEREIPYEECVVASSDGAVLDRAPRWLDLAHAAILMSDLLQLEVDFSPLILARGKSLELPALTDFRDP
jgi:hypothetical protein